VLDRVLEGLGPNGIRLSIISQLTNGKKSMIITKAIVGSNAIEAKS